MAPDPEQISSPSCLAVKLTALEADSFNGYADYSPLSSYICGLCSGTVQQSEAGISAPDCQTSQSCELSMIEQRPELFDSIASENCQVPCSHCDAVLAIQQDEFSDTLSATLVRGRCRVDVAGERFRLTGRNDMNNMPHTPPESWADAAAINGDPIDSDSDRCTGNRLNHALNEGLRPSSDRFACSFSDASGNHCNQRLRLEYDTLSGLDTPGEWQDMCQLRRLFFAAKAAGCHELPDTSDQQ